MEELGCRFAEAKAEEEQDLVTFKRGASKGLTNQELRSSDADLRMMRDTAGHSN